MVFERKQTSFSSFLWFKLLSEAGWIGRDALLMTGINALIYVASTIPTLAFNLFP